MRIAIDTNRYGDLIERVPEVVQVLEAAEKIYLPFVVVAELRQGFRNGKRGRDNEAKLSLFIDKFGVEILYSNAETVDTWATLNAGLIRRGRNIPHNDVWIAALCVQHGLRLYSLDKHFNDMPHVMRA